MEINQEDLIDLLFRVGCFKIEETRLKSGSISPIHIDLPMLNGSPKVLRSLAEALYSKISDLKFDLICGASFTSLPLVVALSLDFQLPMIVKRCDLRLKNNPPQVFHGPHFPGRKVLLVDDVITMGNSLIETADLLKSVGMLVDDAIVLVDQRELFSDSILTRDINLRSFFKTNEIVQYLIAKGISLRSPSVRSPLTPALSQRSFPNISKISCPPPNTITEVKSKGLLRFFSKSKKSESKKNTFVRGGIRATAGPRLISEERRKLDVNLPFSKWDNAYLTQWFGTIGLGMYSANCRKWGNNGENLLSSTELEIEKELGIKNKLHRKKLRLALSVVNKDCDPLAKAASHLDYLWIARWLDDIGLPQYKEPFLEARIDGSVLHHLTLSDLIYLNINSKLHYCSLRHGILVLREQRFDPNCLKRRAVPEDNFHPSPSEIALWTCHRVMEWLRSIDLSEYTSNLRGSGIHGALIIHEPAFDCDLFASLLGIPSSRTLLRRHLTTHFQQLIGAELMQAKHEYRVKNSPLLPASKLTINHGKFLLIKRRLKVDIHPSDFICPLSHSLSSDAAIENGNQNSCKNDPGSSDGEPTRTDSESSF